MSEKHAPWCARFMSCTCMAPGGPNTSAAERISWLMQRYDEGRKACEMVVAERNALRAENERLRTSVRSYYNALLNYGRHWPDCATPKSGDRCDCGLSGWLTEKALERAALAAPPEEKP